VEGLPKGISVANARKTYLQEDQASRGEMATWSQSYDLRIYNYNARAVVG
jgi:hypothetical protein